ncbi:hypothetical protein NDU88_004283 [Pleurodeles waltl]|uniref:Uncharacterized protein n=1 Tax=Pleurodeles waltl TaxID=8319 RepID=A0AAV7LHM1_PLEWA|nr:hypothetical protein NDU88_004283 [Pleurodeles waltl]
MKTQVVNQMELPCQLCQLRENRIEAESTLSCHGFWKQMAMQHAHGDCLGKLLACLLREKHHSAPAVAIRFADGTVPTSQGAINDTFWDCYWRLYLEPATPHQNCVLEILAGTSLPRLSTSQ